MGRTLKCCGRRDAQEQRDGQDAQMPRRMDAQERAR
jgi:hypothetical protein